MEIGDLVTGLPNNHYNCTNEHMTCGKVVAVDPSSRADIKVEIISHEDPSHIGVAWWVASDRFKLIGRAKDCKPKNCMLSHVDYQDKNRKE